MIEELTKCHHDINFIRENLMTCIKKGNATDFIVLEKLLTKTMVLKGNIERLLCAKEVDK